VTETTKDESATQETPSIRPVIEKYHAAVEMVAGYMGRAVALLDGLYAEQDQMIDQLKAVLSRSKSLRRSDFDAIFTDVLAERRRTRETLPALVQGYHANREAIIQEVEDLFRRDVARAGGPAGDRTPAEPLSQAWPALRARLLDSRDTWNRRNSRAPCRVC